MHSPAGNSPTVSFTRHELNEILDLYGRKVAAGEWRDYAIDFGREKAVFSVFRRASEVPLYRIEKPPLGPPAGRLQRGRRDRPHPEARPRPGPGAGGPREGRPAGRGLAGIAPVSRPAVLAGIGLYGCLRWLEAFPSAQRSRPAPDTARARGRRGRTPRGRAPRARPRDRAGSICPRRPA